MDNSTTSYGNDNYESTEYTDDKNKYDYESTKYPEYTDKRYNSYESTGSDYEMDNDKKAYGNHNYESNNYKSAEYTDDKRYNSYEPEHIEYNNEYEYNPIDFK